jgi:hypothetical protein
MPKNPSLVFLNPAIVVQNPKTVSWQKLNRHGFQVHLFSAMVFWNIAMVYTFA